jgi:hypothetical protein
MTNPNLIGKAEIRRYVLPAMYADDENVEKVRLSVYQMIDLSGANTLDAFEPFLNWASNVKNLEFKLHVKEVTGSEITIDHLERFLNKDKIRDQYWNKIFSANTPVSNVHFMNLANFSEKKFASYPTSKISEYIKIQYSLTSMIHPTDHPPISFYSYDLKPPMVQNRDLYVEIPINEPYYFCLEGDDKEDNFLEFLVMMKPQKGIIHIANKLDDPLYDKKRSRKMKKVLCSYTPKELGIDNFEYSIKNNYGQFCPYNGRITFNVIDIPIQPVVTNVPLNVSDKKCIMDDDSDDPNSLISRSDKTNIPLDKSSIGELAITHNNEKFMKKILDEILENEQLIDTNKIKEFTNVDNPKFYFYSLKYFHDLLTIKENKAASLEKPNSLQGKEFHDIYNQLSDYSEFMKMIGITLEFEIPSSLIPFSIPSGTSGSPAYAEMRITSNLPNIKGIECDEKEIWTYYILRNEVNQEHKKQFLAGWNPVTGNDISDGYMLFESNKYDVVTLDVDGTANKLQDFAANVANTISHDHSGNIHEDGCSLPFIRTGGMSIVDSNAAQKLKNSLNRLNSVEQDIADNKPVHLYYDDVASGIRVDVLTYDKGSDTPNSGWKSLCWRIGRYYFLYYGGKDPEHLDIKDEGYLSLSTTSSAGNPYGAYG